MICRVMEIEGVICQSGRLEPGGQLSPWSSQVQWQQKFGLGFSLHVLSIFAHISGSIRPITLIWASQERSSPPAEVEHR